jgi:hypothetical protein
LIVPQAQNAVELTMMENEVPVEVLAFSEGDDWVKAAELQSTSTSITHYRQWL